VFKVRLRHLSNYYEKNINISIFKFNYLLDIINYRSNVNGQTYLIICVQVSILKNILTHDIAIFYLQSICKYYTISK
jgi:hypothetical protein